MTSFWLWMIGLAAAACVVLIVIIGHYCERAAERRREQARKEEERRRAERELLRRRLSWLALSAGRESRRIIGAPEIKLSQEQMMDVASLIAADNDAMKLLKPVFRTDDDGGAIRYSLKGSRKQFREISKQANGAYYRMYRDAQPAWLDAMLYSDV